MVSVSNVALTPETSIVNDVIGYHRLCYQHTGYPPAGSSLTISCAAGHVWGRYVYIYLLGEDRVLSLCEVEIFEFTGKQKHVILKSKFSN